MKYKHRIMSIAIMLIILLTFALIPKAKASSQTTIYLPLVHSNSAYKIDPIPGYYSLNIYMGIQVQWKNCTSVYPIFTLGNVVYGMPWMIYHPECINGVAQLLISFYQPVDIQNMQIEVFTPDGTYILPVSGKWKFGE